ncbi:MAG TPA: CapA family protein [Vicinamibacterales bacterium]|nr:CapA family protein [Vicinamibacterales bacterium]
MATTSKRRLGWLSAALILLLVVIGTPAWPQSTPLTIALTGQSMIRSDVRATAPAAVPAISALVQGADVVFTNFEGTIAEPGQPNESTPRQGPGFLAPPATLDALKALGFNLIDTSNNHSADLKVPGVLNTLKEADRVSLPHAGTGKTLQEATAPAILKTPHGTVALVAMASGAVAAGAAATATQPGVNELRVGPGNVPNVEDTTRILQSIRDAAKKADLVIVYQHNHVFDKPFGLMFTEGLPDRLRPPDWLEKWAHAEIDAGADLIVMHGAPLLHGIEIYHDKPIFYDLGNFIFNAPLTMWTLQEPMTWESVVARLEFDGKKVRSITLRPIVLNFMGEGQPEAHDPYANNTFIDTRGLPAPAKGDQAAYILQRVVELSQPFGTRVEVRGDKATVSVTGGK